MMDAWTTTKWPTRFFENMDGGRFRLAGKDPGLGGQGNKAVNSFHSFQI